MTDRRPDEDYSTPFSFKVTITLAIVYLGWRLVQGIAWLVARLVG